MDPRGARMMLDALPRGQRAAANELDALLSRKGLGPRRSRGRSTLAPMELQLHRGYLTPVGSFWHFYTDFPERYDRFALSTLEAAKKVHELVDFTGARVLDIASGTGKNALEHARLA